MEKNQKKMSFQVLTLITTPKLADKAAEIFNEEHLPLQYRFHAEGTAPSEIMDMLGLGSIDKCVMISLIPKDLSASMLETLRKRLQMHSVNSGIAFTVPLTGVNNLILRMLTKNAEDNVLSSSGKGGIYMSEMSHVLVLVVVNRGFSGDVMEAAKSSGARGGTVVHSRNVGNEEVSSFWGLDIQEEQEIVMILAESENKIPIMKSISEKCGTHSKAKGLVMSMPIDSVIGI